MANEFKVKNGLVVDQGGATISGSVNISGSAVVTGSYNLLATGGQNLFFNNSGQLGSSATGAHITMNPAGNTTTLSQVVTAQNGLNVTPGGNATTFALRTTVGAYPGAVLASFISGSVTALSISGSGMFGTGSFNYSGNIIATTFTGSSAQLTGLVSSAQTRIVVSDTSGNLSYNTALSLTGAQGAQ
jgi:hypothetical protein